MIFLFLSLLKQIFPGTSGDLVSTFEFNLEISLKMHYRAASTSSTKYLIECIEGFTGNYSLLLTKFLIVKNQESYL